MPAPLVTTLLAAALVLAVAGWPIAALPPLSIALALEVYRFVLAGSPPSAEQTAAEEEL